MIKLLASRGSNTAARPGGFGTKCLVSAGGTKSDSLKTHTLLNTT